LVSEYDTSKPAGQGFADRVVQAGEWSIRYRESGTGSPLVWVHGAGGPEITRGAELLAERHRVIAVELPGFGDEVNDRTQGGVDAAQIVLAFADALGLDRFALWGTSMGGVVALWTAIAAGDRLDRLILDAPAIFRPDGPSPAELSPEEQLAAFHAHPERKHLSPPDPERMARSWPLVERLVGPAYDEQLAAGAASLETPTLVLCGSRDGLFGVAPGRELKRLQPRAQFTIVYDAAHDISGDRPEAFAAYVSDFIERGRTFVVQDRSTLIYA